MQGSHLINGIFGLLGHIVFYWINKPVIEFSHSLGRFQQLKGK